MASEEVAVVRLRNGRPAGALDRVAVEEPLEIRLQGRPFATIMRTPGADCELAAGFLFAERILRSADDIGTIAHCRDTVRLKPDTTTANVALIAEAAGPGSLVAPATAENVVNVTLLDALADVVERALAERRQVVASASCGVCGRLTIESLRANLALVPQGVTIAATMVSAWPERLRAAQPLFDETGGLHAAGLFDRHGVLVTSAEDVGRHNAVDKVVGRLLLDGRLPAPNMQLVVSGRAGYEIVQKSIGAGIPLMAAVGAPSSLAVSMAREFNQTLVGFLRGDRFNVYSAPHRLTKS